MGASDPERSLLWLRGATDEGKDVLIFNSGAEPGDLHIYTHEKSVGAKDVQNRAEEELGYSKDQPFLDQDLGELEFGKGNGKRWKLID